MADLNLVKAVRDHATANYNLGGWDIIVECWSNEDIAREIGTARTEAAAIRRVAAIAKQLGTQRDEVRSEIF